MSSVSEIIGVRQREYGITNSAGVPCIGTPNVSSCVVMIVYNRMCKEAVLAHMDASTATPDNVKRIFEKITDRPGALKVTFVGGWVGSGRTTVEKYIPQLILDLNKNYGHVVDQRHLLRYRTFEGGYSYVGIDTRTGKVTALEQPKVCPEFATVLDFKDISFSIEKVPLEFAADTRGSIDFDQIADLDESAKKYYNDLKK